MSAPPLAAAESARADRIDAVVTYVLLKGSNASDSSKIDEVDDNIDDVDDIIDDVDDIIDELDPAAAFLEARRY